MEDFIVIAVIAIGVISSIVSKLSENKQSRQPERQPSQPEQSTQRRDSGSVFDQIFGPSVPEPDFGMGHSETDTSEDTLECEECGYMNKDSYKFCLACGNTLAYEKSSKKKHPINYEHQSISEKKDSTDNLHSVHKKAVIEKPHQSITKSIELDLDIDNISKAIIMNEILMPPVSLRKERQH